MRLFLLAQHLEHRASEIMTNPKIQVAAGTILTTTPWWVSELQAWLALLATVFGVIIGAHGVYKICQPFVNKVINCLKSHGKK